MKRPNLLIAAAVVFTGLGVFICLVLLVQLLNRPTTETKIIYIVPTTAPTVTPFPTITPTQKGVLLSDEELSNAGELTWQTPNCSIKGNIDLTGEKIYHLPGQKYYDATVIHPDQGERWFCTEDDALTNGWRKSKV